MEKRIELTKLIINKVKELRFTLSNFKDQDLLDMRFFVKLYNKEEIIPTQKGFSLNVKNFREFKKIIDDLEQKLVDLGLLQK